MGAYVNKESVTRRRWRRVRYVLLLVVLVACGALFDPAIVAPFGPLAMRAEEVDAHFTRCGNGARSIACVVDGDTFRLGNRTVRMTGIDAPERSKARCPAEAALAERAADRLVTLLNQGQVDLVGHVLVPHDRFGRDLRVVKRGGVSLGDQLRAEGLAHRYVGVKRSWC